MRASLFFFLVMAACGPRDGFEEENDSGAAVKVDGAADAGPVNSNDSGMGGVDAGSGSDAGDPYNTPTACTSGTYWMGGDTKSAEMHPGVACRTCHVVLGKASGKDFDISGTVYPTAHEPDDCNGLSGVTVVITDANNVDHSLAVTNAGNFYHDDALGFAKFATPYRAKVVRNGMTRAMIAAQTDGNCNACHTEKGTQNAPGRVMAP